ncbi:CPBP family intramembrane glutamic endopeptidase [Kitasatospora viridis]|uniref:CAAX prenyl protease-like protein n=1 Tax=Kitasatospora viridis TaxID=281105 RepID=A0A561SF76_9ACTN|nr:CPBP family intramembrane glutamic endopeptidase [Kitasatospora viridis]TWF73519.1 CAAX prenyl protease-like protein [Kitasatospora viridis]
MWNGRDNQLDQLNQLDRQDLLRGVGRQRGRPRWKAEAGLYVLVAFLGAGLLGALQPSTGVPEEVLQLTQFGPALGVLMVALLRPSRARERLAGTLPGPPPGRPPGRRDRTAPLVLLCAPLIIALSSAGYAVVHGSLAFTDPRGLADPFALIVPAQLVGACGEEIGWRCFLQPLLRTRFGPLTASVLVGLVWGGWHVQAFTRGPAYAGGFLTATVAMSVLLGLALERVRSNRLLLAGGFHALVNLGMLVFMPDDSGTAMLLFGAACLLAALPWVLRAPTVRMTVPAAHGAR